MANDINLKELTIEEVIEAVEAGELSVAEALEKEAAGKNRTTLIEQLQEIAQEDPETDSDQDQTDKSKVSLLKNIKYKGERHKIGDEIEVSAKDKDVFADKGIIKGD